VLIWSFIPCLFFSRVRNVRFLIQALAPKQLQAQKLNRLFFAVQPKGYGLKIGSASREQFLEFDRLALFSAVGPVPAFSWRGVRRRPRWISLSLPGACRFRKQGGTHSAAPRPERTRSTDPTAAAQHEADDQDNEPLERGLSGKAGTEGMYLSIGMVNRRETRKTTTCNPFRRSFLLV
jgi:hypothetical protein